MVREHCVEGEYLASEQLREGVRQRDIHDRYRHIRLELHRQRHVVLILDGGRHDAPSERDRLVIQEHGVAHTRSCVNGHELLSG